MKPSLPLKSLVFAALLCGGVSASAFAQDATPPPQPPAGPPPSHRPPPGRPPRSLLFEALDTNHDGVISADELAHATESLKKLDKNGDGQLTPDELRLPPPPGDQNNSSQMQPPPNGGPAPQGTGPVADDARKGQHPFPPPESDAQGGDERPPGPPMHPHHGPKLPDSAPDSGGANSDLPGQHAPSAVLAQRPSPPRLADDPAANRFDNAQGPGEPPPGRPRGPRMSLFEVLDTDHDGKLSDAEIDNAPVVLRKYFKMQAGQNDGANVRPPPPQRPAD